MIEDENISLMCAWNQDEKQSPEIESYTEETLLGTSRTRKAIISSNDTESGNYYLWAKVLIRDNEIIQVFGPYTIKDHTTLIATNTETSTTSGFLGNTSLQRNIIESVRIETSFNSHSLSDENCWDVSQSQDGRYIAWYEDADSDGHPEVTIAGNGGVVANSNSNYLFANIGSEIEETTQISGLENLDTGLVNNMTCMFYNCKKLNSLDLSNFNTSNVTNMSKMFFVCNNLTSLDVSNFNTSNVTNMSSMFTFCNNLTSLDVSNFNTSNVTNMSGMFSNCDKLNTLDLSNFNTSNVTNMKQLFYNCKKLTELKIDNFNMANVASYENMLYNVPKTVTIKTNANTKTWIEENIPDYKNCIITT